MIDKRDILATSVRDIEGLKRRYDLDKGNERDSVDLSGYLTNDIFPIGIDKGGTGVATAEDALLSLSNYSIYAHTADNIQYLDMSADAIAVASSGGAAYSMTNTNEMFGGLTIDGKEVAVKPVLLWSNASPTSEFAAQTVTLSQSIEDFTHYSMVYRTDGRADRNLSVGLIPKTQTAHLQSIINYVSYRTCTISTNKATFTAATYQWTLADSGSRGTNNFFCMPMYIYGWKL